MDDAFIDKLSVGDIIRIDRTYYVIYELPKKRNNKLGKLQNLVTRSRVTLHLQRWDNLVLVDFEEAKDLIAKIKLCD